MPTLGDHLHLVRILTRQGVVRPSRPDRLVRGLAALLRWGTNPAGGYGLNAAMNPSREAIIDERRTLTFAEVATRTNAIANGMELAGIKPGDRVAILCRNHAGWVEATIALSKLGAHALYLNTGFAAPQIAGVCEHEKPAGIVYDEEFAGALSGLDERVLRFVGWKEDVDATGGPPSLDELAAGDARPRKPPEREGRFVILTSGTTGTPKGADHDQPASLHPAAALLEAIPLRARQRTLICAPLFHSWGFAHFHLGMVISTTLVLRRRFDPQDVLQTIQETRSTGLIAVPLMLQRLVELDAEIASRFDTSSLRVIAASGSAMPGELALQVMDRFGDVLYNLYGTTEVAWASVAGPRDLRAAPGTAGRPPRGTVVRILDEQGAPLPRGVPGRLFVGNVLAMRSYTAGDSKHMVDGLMDTGDLGYFDDEGRLFVAGRDDEMIVSGGENVFPREVEDELAGHPAVQDVAVVGAEDREFGQRLCAFVVLRPGKTATEDELKEHIRGSLAAFKVPREVTFLEELPRTSTGKVIKRALGKHSSTG